MALRQILGELHALPPSGRGLELTGELLPTLCYRVLGHLGAS